MIDRFVGEYRFLSNFYPCEVIYDGIKFRSVEHAYQAAKSIDWSERVRIQKLKTAGEAKKEGKKLKLRDGWESMKLNIMLDLLRQKFSDSNPELMEWLKATGDAKLVEGNDWGDTFWGVCDGIGKNWLGNLLSQVRAEIREE